MTQILSLNDESINRAADILKNSGIVAMPTETVYGLAADARSDAAVTKVFKAKGRPKHNPLIVHVNELDDVLKIAKMSKKEQSIAQSFWPGPLTMILKCRKDSGLSELVSAGLSTVAVRIPSNKGARKLIKACDFPLAAPSANKSGSLSSTTPAHVESCLGSKIDLILAAGACRVGLESTVIDCSGPVPVILRAGAITAEEIKDVTGGNVEYDLCGDGEVKSPGQLLKHYAPSIPVRMNAIDLEEGEALLAFGSAKFMGIKGGGAASSLPDSRLRNLSKDGDVYEAAANLFAMMRDLDKPSNKGIAVMAVPDQGIGVAINDRLTRASQ